MSKVLKKKLVSIVITTKNEEKHIETCLKSIASQNYDNIEIIVVDNYSDDKTIEIALKYTPKVYSKGPERSAQRNFGMIEIAIGDYVMYVDADMILSPELITSCVKEIERTGSMALYISEIILGTTFWCKVRRFERKFYDATVIDSARFFKKSVFSLVGGFDEKIDFGEEWDIDKEIKKYGTISLLGHRIQNTQQNWSLSKYIERLGINRPAAQNVIYHNESEFKVKAYIKKKGEYAKGFGKYIKKWGLKDPDLKKQFGLVYRYFIVFFEKGKWKMAVQQIHLFSGMFFLRFCVGIKFLQNRQKEMFKK